jgi:hypothetical protein
MYALMSFGTADRRILSLQEAISVAASGQT